MTAGSPGLRDQAAQAARNAERARLLTFRQIAADWLVWLRDVKGAKPSSLEDYAYMLAEPGTPHRRGKGVSAGHVMAAFGDRPIREITPKDIATFLRKMDRELPSPRAVNKRRQMLSAIFNYARRVDVDAVETNPVTGTDKRRDLPPAALDFYEPEEIEALARAAAAGAHRIPEKRFVADDELLWRQWEDRRDGEMLRVAAYTGLRLGELRALQWKDVDLINRSLIVRRAVSAGVETTTKGHRVRIIPLADQAARALARTGQRDDFLGPDDYVFCSRLGERLDESALRRRYHAAREAAGLRNVKLHGLRHAAGSLAARQSDALFVKEFLGHSRLAVTERYMHRKARPEDVQRLTRAFSPIKPPDGIETIDADDPELDRSPD